MPTPTDLKGSNIKFKDRALSGILNNCALNGALPIILANIETLATDGSTIDPSYPTLKNIFVETYGLSKDLSWVEFQELISSQKDNFFLLQLLFAPVLRQYLIKINGNPVLPTDYAEIQSNGRYQPLTSQAAAKLYNQFSISLNVQGAGDLIIPLENADYSVTLILRNEHFYFENYTRELAERIETKEMDVLPRIVTGLDVSKIGAGISQKTNDQLDALKKFIKIEHEKQLRRRATHSPNQTPQAAQQTATTQIPAPAHATPHAAQQTATTQIPASAPTTHHSATTTTTTPSSQTLPSGATVISGRARGLASKSYYVFADLRPSTNSEGAVSYRRKAEFLDQEQEKNLLSEKGLKVFAPSGYDYQFSYKDGNPTARLLNKNVQDPNRLALTIINMIDNVIAKSNIVYVNTKNPAVAAIAQEYIKSLQKNGFKFDYKITLDNQEYNHENNPKIEEVKKTIDGLNPSIENAETGASDGPNWSRDVQMNPDEKTQAYRNRLLFMPGNERDSGLDRNLDNGLGI